MESLILLPAREIHSRCIFCSVGDIYGIRPCRLRVSKVLVLVVLPIHSNIHQDTFRSSSNSGPNFSIQYLLNFFFFLIYFKNIYHFNVAVDDSFFTGSASFRSDIIFWSGASAYTIFVTR